MYYKVTCQLSLFGELIATAAKAAHAEQHLFVPLGSESRIKPVLCGIRENSRNGSVGIRESILLSLGA